jgi:uncharacterized membrane protein YbhN (UPF0104 family)
LLGFAFYCLRRAELLKPNVALTAVSVSVLYVSFFVLNGIILSVLAASSNEVVIQNPFYIVGVVAAAWLAGFIIPGAPAGLGIREAILTSGLVMAGCEPIALAAAVGYRIITLSGDVVVALIGFIARNRSG